MIFISDGELRLNTENSTVRYPEERKLVSVLFADIIGFSHLADQLDFEIVSDVLRSMWLKLDQVIEEYGGFIDKHIGDAFMVLWGAPRAQEDDPERAVGAGLAVLQALEEFKTESGNPLAKKLEMRVGIHTGLVLAGYVGIKGEYTVMGDTVNIAKRMEEFAEPGSLLISEATYQFIRGAFQIKRLRPVAVRDTERLTNVYQVNEPLQQPSKLRYRSRGGLETNLVAREEELEKLKEIFEQTQGQKKPSCALIAGEVGVGKSRLLMEFVSHLEGKYPQLTVMSSRALEQTEQVPYYLWRELWFNRFGLNEDDPLEDARQKVIEGVLALWGQQLGEYPAVEAAHFIGDLIGITFEKSRYLESYREDPEERTKHAYLLHAELFTRALTRGPVLLILDDLHWADRSSLQLIDYLRRIRNKDMSLLILGGARPEFVRDHPELVQGTSYLELGPIPKQAEIVRSAYPILKEAPADLLQALAVRSGGNPYFLEELVKTIIPGGFEGMQAADIEGNLPRSLRMLLQSRIDSLSMEARATALFAAVVGRVFWKGAVLSAFRGSKGVTQALGVSSYNIIGKVQSALDELMEKEMAFPRVGSAFSGEKEYIFKHSLLRDVAYERLPKKYRAEAHLAVASWLSERANPERSVSIARHFELAGSHTKALNYYTEAANYARSMGNDQEADELQYHARTL